MLSCSVLFVLLFGVGQAARILGLFPYPGFSHYAVFRPLLEELAARGHSLVVVSHFPRADSNFTEISLEGTTPDFNNRLDMAHFSREPSTFLSNMEQLYRFNDLYEPALRHPSVLRLTESHFDLVIVEMFNTDLFMGLIHKIGAPFIGISSSEILPWWHAALGNPTELSYAPTIFAGKAYRGGLHWRLSNALIHAYCSLDYYFRFQPKTQWMAEKYLGPLPPLAEVARSASLMLLNSHHSVHLPQAFAPSVVNVGGLHLKPPGSLPQDLEKLVKNSANGFIYFSMGSMLRGETMPEEIQRTFVKVFSSLKQTVLWKWEGKEMPKKSPNIHTSAWFPQRDLLCHDNIVLYISHGGLLGLTEAIDCGVPNIIIPMYGDQEYNTEALVSQGMGVRLDFTDITETTLRTALKIALSSEFKENTKKVSRLFKDRPMSPMATAVYWTEYVIRHKRAVNLRPKSVDLAWYQILLLDAMCVIILFAIVLFYLLKYIKCVCTRNVKLKKN